VRVVLVTPVAHPSIRGNAVTVARLARGLGGRGVEVGVVDLSRVRGAELDRMLEKLRPDVLHAFHAFRAAPRVIPYGRQAGIPLVVSLTGTDVNHDLYDPLRRDATIAALRAARAIVAFHESIRAKVGAELPDLTARIEVIPQSVTMDDEPYRLADLVPWHADEIRFLLPAGIRRVKNVLLPFAPLAQLAERHALRLLIAGPIIEEGEGARLRAALKGADWASYLGEVRHAQMASLLDAVDVVINSSLSEGGMANSILEAMARGKPVLASDIEGNRSLVEDGVDGLLFRSPAEFTAKAEVLILDPALRARLGAAARAKVRRLYPPEGEIDAHRALYRRVAQG
jgi:glycosyltransferase involved in cell wall biosynthesis